MRTYKWNNILLTLSLSNRTLTIIISKLLILKTLLKFKGIFSGRVRLYLIQEWKKAKCSGGFYVFDTFLEEVTEWDFSQDRYLAPNPRLLNSVLKMNECRKNMAGKTKLSVCLYRDVK